MNIDDPVLVVLGVAAVLATTLGLAFLWDRRGIIIRSLMATTIVLALAATCAVQLNQLTSTYPSWEALFGTTSANAGADLGGGGDAPRPGGGRLLSVSVQGKSSGLTMPMAVYLPAAYDTPDGASRRFPVIEAFHGYPGSPRTWIDKLNVLSRLDKEMADGRMAPTVVLFPYLTPQHFLDTECTNMVGGPQAETFLTTDVPAYAAAHLRVRTDRAGWGAMGFSAGGFCAMNLGLKHPDRYAAAVSMSGDAASGIKVGDGSENTTNNVAWRLRNLPQPTLSLYVVWSADDKARTGSREVVRLAKPPMTVTAVELPHGGHNHAFWRRTEGPAFDWLSARLARDLPDTGRRACAAPGKPGAAGKPGDAGKPGAAGTCPDALPGCTLAGTAGGANPCPPDCVTAKPGAGKPGAGKPAGGEPGSDEPGDGKPGAGKPHSGKPHAGKPAGGEPGSDKPDAGTPDAGKPVSGEPGTGKPGAGKPGAGEPGPGKPGPGKPGAAGKPGAGKPGAASACASGGLWLPEPPASKVTPRPGDPSAPPPGTPGQTATDPSQPPSVAPEPARPPAG
ncbi:alpha/beta hydrolase-fold protein [Krasilnikovia sp. MM14-A1259]|uniref:alpha/beta hydrolase-fold protein n=1 Tax=Krasilnikovia sp. MM14-A1259 TaxID=3373539 RepID=UPI0038267C1C